ncbi:MAG: TIM44-like domain-containing protein [Firmicutes bacterium]|nr:TIM44-like domain-containing protein [Bacillota bacterium]
MKRFGPLLLGLCLCLGLCLIPVSPADADFGDFSGGYDYSYDYGSYDSGGYDYGSYDYDDYGSYDYGNNGSYGNYGNYGYSSGESVGFLPILLFAGIIGLIIFLFVRKFMGGGSGHSVNIQQVEAPANLRPMAEYSELDPNFDEASFKEKLSNLYVQMQNCWTAKDIEPLRPYFTDGFFTQMERQLDQLKKAGRTNHVDRISVMGVTLRGFTSDEKEDRIVAILNTRIVDYTVDDATGNLISGSQTAEKFMTYEWTLSRESGQTTEEHTEAEKIYCPGCGAPLDINASARCPYCGSVIVQREKDWALCSIRGLAQRTVGK